MSLRENVLVSSYIKCHDAIKSGEGRPLYVRAIIHSKLCVRVVIHGPWPDPRNEILLLSLDWEKGIFRPPSLSRTSPLTFVTHYDVVSTYPLRDLRFPPSLNSTPITTESSTNLPKVFPFFHILIPPYSDKPFKCFVPVTPNHLYSEKKLSTKSTFYVDLPWDGFSKWSPLKKGVIIPY